MIMLASAHTQHHANGGHHINMQLKANTVSPRAKQGTLWLSSSNNSQLIVYILYKQGITWDVMASCSAMTVANLFHFWLTKIHPLVASKAARHWVLIAKPITFQ
jgi:hypothetical protein